MKTTEKATMPWVITELRGQLFGFDSASVREMVIMPEVSPIPGVPGYLRGVMNLRGHVMPVVDLRRRLNMPSSSEDLDGICALMEQRAQDHRKWIEELEASVRENRRFGLATDPHQCAFGKWYDKFHTNNLIVAGYLKKFEGPHARIHAIALETQQLVAKGQAERAMRRIQETRAGELSDMLQLFQEFPSVIRGAHTEIAVVLEHEGGRYAVCVDSVVSVERFPEGAFENLSSNCGATENGLVNSVAKRAKSSELVMILTAASILDSTLHAGELEKISQHLKNAA